jgi:hypothetical protein
MFLTLGDIVLKFIGEIDAQTSVRKTGGARSHDDRHILPAVEQIQSYCAVCVLRHLESARRLDENDSTEVQPLRKF